MEYNIAHAVEPVAAVVISYFTRPPTQFCSARAIKMISLNHVVRNAWLVDSLAKLQHR